MPRYTAPVRIYLACTIRGDRSALPAVRLIHDALVALGHEVLTARFLDEHAEAEDGRLSEQQVFERDLRWLDACDLIVAEASGSTYGVGFEVGYVLARAERTGQRVVLVYDAARRQAISRLVPGNNHQACVTFGYDSLAALEAFLEDHAGLFATD